MGSLVIGVLLIILALWVMRKVKSLIIGESADPLVHDDIEKFLAACAEVAEVYNLITLQWGSNIVVTVKVRMRQHSDTQKKITAINACAVAPKQKRPAVNWIF